MEKKLSEMSESELKEFKEVWPKEMSELTDHINQLVDRQHDYGTCVYAMSLAALAAFNYVAGKLGVTGFQASCADLDFIARNRSMKDGFRLMDYNKLLYPQYLTREHFPSIGDLITDNKMQLKKRAAELISENNGHTHPDVLAHWEMLSNLE